MLSIESYWKWKWVKSLLSFYEFGKYMVKTDYMYMYMYYSLKGDKST